MLSTGRDDINPTYRKRSQIALDELGTVRSVYRFSARAMHRTSFFSRFHSLCISCILGACRRIVYGNLARICFDMKFQSRFVAAVATGALVIADTILVGCTTH